MPIEVGIWRLGERPERVGIPTLESESRLEETLAQDVSILSPQLMLIGRQVPTAFGKFIDLLAIDPTGKLSVIELKKDKTPRVLVAQVLDYASWVSDLSYEDIAAIYSANNEGNHAHHLIFTQLIARLFGPDQRRNQVIARLCAGAARIACGSNAQTATSWAGHEGIADAPEVDAAMRFDQEWNRIRSRAGIPSISAIIVRGSGNAYPRTRSIRPVGAAAFSSSPHTL